jgi:hypothetical protein
MGTLIHAGTVITAVNGGPVLHNQGILIENGKIEAIDVWDSFGEGHGADSHPRHR